MRISVFYAHIKTAAEQNDLIEEAVLKALRQQGICACDVDYNTLRNAPSGFAQYLNAHGFAVSNVYVVFEWKNGFNKEHIDELVQNTKKAGCDKLMAIPGFIRENDDAETCRRNMLYALRYLCDRAEEQNITVTLEDYDHEASPVSTIEGLRYFFDGESRLRFTLDTGNFYYSGQNVWEAMRLFSEKIVHVHLKDRRIQPVPGTAPLLSGVTGQALYPSPCGQGVIGLADIINALIGAGYDGYATIEHFHAENALMYMLESAAFVRELIRQSSAPSETCPSST